MEEELEIILRAVDDASDTFQSVADTAEGMGESLQEGAEQGTSGFEEVEESAEGAKDPMEQIGDILGGFVGVEVFSQLADALWDVADKAGTFEDSLMRARLEAEGAGIDVNEMTDTVSELSRVTGRAGSEIRESFIKATARGVTDMGSFKSMMEGAGAQATLFGTDIQSMADKFSNMAMRSTLMERSLASTGITMEELAEAMGMTGATADEVKEKWKELDTNQRAAILGQAATMNEGQTANEAYKHSWAGLQAQIDIAKGRLERLAGEVLLPVLVPALEVAARVLNFVGDVVNSLITGPFGGLISVVGAAAAAFALAVPAYIAVQGAITLLTATAIPAATALWAMVAPLLPFIALGAAVVLVIYEVGKAFGWWSDASSMLDAIWAGVQRLWSAFINHPDVQGLINGIKVAWQLLQPYIQSVVGWVMSFFNETNGSKFDAVRLFIDVVGKAWQAMTLPIRLVISVVKLLWNAIKQWYTITKSNVDKVRALFRALPGRIRSAISSLVNVITKPFKDAYKKVKDKVDDIKSYIRGITNVDISSLVGKLTKPFTDAYDKICKEVDKIKQKASEIAHNPLSVIGLGFDYEGMMEELQKQSTNNNVYSTGSEELTLDHNINFKFDFTGLPDGVREENLIMMLQGAITDKSVISQLVNSPDFQSLDSKVKNRILLKNGRARGV